VKKSIKSILTVVSIMAIITSLAACSNGAGSSTAAETQTTSQPEVTSEEATTAQKETGSEEETETEEPDETEEQIVIDTSWYTDDNTAMTTGTYFVGKDIAAGNYIFTCTDPESTTWVYIFDSEDSYWNYFRSSRFTYGEESDALEANAFSIGYARGEHTLAVNLQEGYVMKLDYANGTLVRADGSDEAGKTDIGRKITVTTGIYNSGDIAKGGYMLTCTEANYAIKVLAFENKAAYDSYFSSKRVTMGEEGAAIEANAMYSYYIEPGYSMYINVRDDMVFVFSDGTAQMEEVSMSWAQ